MLLKILPLIFASLFFTACAGEVRTGRLTVCVRDGFTDAPIDGACVAVPEAGGRYYTDSMGLTPVMELPVIPDGEYEKLLPSGVGRVTLIVTAEGYTPYVLLYARIAPSADRSVEILLFPGDGSLGVFPVIEAPDESWCAELVRKFAD